jgi:uncharacterized membrane protein
MLAYDYIIIDFLYSTSQMAQCSILFLKRPILEKNDAKEGRSLKFARR